MEEQLRRAYLLARKLNLSPETQEELIKQINGEKAKEPIVKKQEIPQTKFEEFISLLKNRKYTEASELLLHNYTHILHELQGQKEEDCGEFFSLLPKLEKTHELLKLTSFGRMFERAKNDEDRFYQLQNFIDKRSKNLSREDCLILNLFFSNPIVWFGPDSNNYKKIVAWILKESENLPARCNALSFFESIRFQRLDKVQEDSIWQTILQSNLPTLWKGTAYLHLYLNEEFKEELIWNSWSYFQSSENGEKEWEKARKWASEYFREGEQKRKPLNLLVHPLNLSNSLIKDYIADMGVPTHSNVLEFILDYLKTQDVFEFELDIYFHLSKCRLLTEDELHRITALGAQTKKKDLVKNAEILLFVRGLDKNKEDDFKLFRRQSTREDKYFAKSIYDFSETEKKFVNAYIRTVPWLHYFTNKNMENFRTLKFTESFFDPSIRSMQSTYRKLPFKIPPKQLMAKHLISKELLSEIPSAFPSIPDNSWGKALASFSQLLAYNHLNRILDKTRHSSKAFRCEEFRRWLDRGSADLRLSWAQLQSALLELSDDEIAKILRKLICRFASLACRDLQLSLSTLAQGSSEYQDMRIDLESWFLRGT